MKEILCLLFYSVFIYIVYECIFMVKNKEVLNSLGMILYNLLIE